jgi:hypothetical protein
VPAKSTEQPARTAWLIGVLDTSLGIGQSAPAIVRESSLRAPLEVRLVGVYERGLVVANSLADTPNQSELKS